MYLVLLEDVWQDSLLAVHQSVHLLLSRAPLGPDGLQSDLPSTPAHQSLLDLISCYVHSLQRVLAHRGIIIIPTAEYFFKMKGITKWCKGTANATFLQNERGYGNWCKVLEEMVHRGRKCTKVRKSLKWDIENKVEYQKKENRGRK